MCEPRRRNVRRAWLQGHLEHSLLGLNNNFIPLRAGRFSGQSEACEVWSSIRKARSQESKAPSFGALDSCGQATKGTWGMSWRQKPMKGVEDCDKSGVVVKRALIPEFPN